MAPERGGRSLGLIGASVIACSAILAWGCGSTTTPTPRPPGSASPAPIGTSGAIALRQVATGLKQPLDVVDAGDVAGRLYVVEQGGRIVVLDDGSVRPTPFLDLTGRISAGGERGLLSVAFAPDYGQSGRFFVDYTDPDGNTVIERFARSASGAAEGASPDPGSGTTILKIDQPAANHNGGEVLFGPDGMLYVGMGDGGGGASENGQRGDILLGKMLRLDVAGDSYAIPPDNPFRADPAVSDEIWALGLRNPWRFSFDRKTGDLWIGDVGASRWEEVDFQPAASHGGENYGWPVMEGPDCGSAACDPSRYVLPVAAYPHGAGDCAIIGGFVYRGERFADLRGTYLFGDECSGRIWALTAADAASRTAAARLVLETGLALSSFGEDRAGELYVTDLSGGGAYQVVGAP